QVVTEGEGIEVAAVGVGQHRVIVQQRLDAGRVTDDIEQIDRVEDVQGVELGADILPLATVREAERLPRRSDGDILGGGGGGQGCCCGNCSSDDGGDSQT